MRKLPIALTLLCAVALVAPVAAPADAKKRHSHKPSGIEGVVLNSTCAGACVDPPPPQPAYTGSDLTVSVTRVADGALVATSHPTDGTFRFRLKRGHYLVAAAVAQPTPTPQSTAMPPNCWQGDSQEAQVRRHRFTHVQLHVGNVCIV